MELQEKEEKILKAAIKEFGAKGFEKASTNDIIKAAGVSKGLLFHYYNNKNSLYLAALEYSTDYMIDAAKQVIWHEKKDPLERFNEIGQMKVRIFTEQPDLYEFLFSSQMNTPATFMSTLSETEQIKFQSIQEKQHQSYSLLFANMDYSCFREDLELPKIIEMISYVMDGLGNKYWAKLKGKTPKEVLDHVDELMKEMQSYLDFMKKLFYDRWEEMK